MQFLKSFVIISIFYLWLAVAQDVAPVANCSRIFISNSRPGYFYRLYPLPYGGVPYGMPATNATDWVSRLAFMGTPLYAGNTKSLTINNFFTSTSGDIQYGDVLGNNITTTNFTMAANAWFVPDTSGWFKFFLSTNSVGELMIVNSTGAYCCGNPTHNSVAEQFILTSINNQVDGTVYLYKGLHYQFTTSFVNENGNAYYYTYFIDPNGYYKSPDNYVYQMNSGDPSDVVTCNYGIEFFTTTMPYTGTVTSTNYQQLYKIESGGSVTIQEWEIIGIPSAYYVPPTTSSSISTLSDTSSSSVIILSSSSVDVSSSSVLSSIVSSPSISDHSSSTEELPKSSASESSSYNGSVSINPFGDSSVMSSSITDLESSSISTGVSFGAGNLDSFNSSSVEHNGTSEVLSPSITIMSSHSEIGSNSLVRNIPSPIESNSTNSIPVTLHESGKSSSVYSASGPIFRNASEPAESNSVIQQISDSSSVGSISEVVSSSLQPSSAIQESMNSLGESNAIVGSSIGIESDIHNPTITSFTGSIRTVPSPLVISPSSSDNENAIVTVITTTVVETDGYNFRGCVSLVGFPDDSENAIKRTITTTITSTLCPVCLETAINVQPEGGTPNVDSLPVPKNGEGAGAVAPIDSPESSIQQLTPQVSHSEKPSPGLATFAASPNGQPRFGVDLSNMMVFILSACVLFL